MSLLLTLLDRGLVLALLGHQLLFTLLFGGFDLLEGLGHLLVQLLQALLVLSLELPQSLSVASLTSLNIFLKGEFLLLVVI